MARKALINCVSCRFEDDLNEIVDYISIHLQNPIAAENFVDAVETAIYERLSCAEAFEPYSSAKERRYPYYRISVKNYTIFLCSDW